MKPSKAQLLYENAALSELLSAATSTKCGMQFVKRLGVDTDKAP